SSSVAVHGNSTRSMTGKEFTANLQHNGFYEFLPDNYPGQKKSPLMIFLHGAGEKGNGVPGQGLPTVLNFGVPMLINRGATMSFVNPATQEVERFVVLAPQLPSTQFGWTNNFITPIVDYAKQ